MIRHTKATTRPRLEALEDRDVPAYLTASIPGQGVQIYSGSWQQINGNEANLVADGVAAFPGRGVWLYNGGWQQITANNPASLDSESGWYFDRLGQQVNLTNVVAQFPGQGLWLYTARTASADAPASGGWQQLTTNNASTEAVGGNGEVVAEFPGQGVWFYGTDDWRELTAANATSLAMGTSVVANTQVKLFQTGPPVVAAAFGADGVWRTVLDGAGNGSWTQLTASVATMVGVNSLGVVVGAFPGWGVWVFADNWGFFKPGWSQMTTADAEWVGIFCLSNPSGASGGEFYGQYDGAGVWCLDFFNQWHHISAVDATTLGVGHS
jgi:hypothetical protein